jgi:hypothetical protein
MPPVQVRMAMDEYGSGLFYAVILFRRVQMLIKTLTGLSGESDLGFLESWFVFCEYHLHARIESFTSAENTAPWCPFAWTRLFFC